MARRRNLRLVSSSSDEEDAGERHNLRQTPNPTPLPLAAPLVISDDDDDFLEAADAFAPPSPPPPAPDSSAQSAPPFGCPVEEILGRLGLRVRREWLDGCIADLERTRHGFAGLDDSGKARLCFERFLFADMNVCGAGVLPENVDSMHKVEMEGPFVLQVDEIVNISVPLRERYHKAIGGYKRCLKLSLTDGCQRVYAMEYRPISELEVLAPAGLKVAVHNVQIRRGLLMIVPEVFNILGGLVDYLESARERLVREINKPPRGKRRQPVITLSQRASLAAWPSGNSDSRNEENVPALHAMHNPQPAFEGGTLTRSDAGRITIEGATSAGNFMVEGEFAPVITTSCQGLSAPHVRSSTVEHSAGRIAVEESANIYTGDMITEESTPTSRTISQGFSTPRVSTYEHSTSRITFEEPISIHAGDMLTEESTPALRSISRVFSTPYVRNSITECSAGRITVDESTNVHSGEMMVDEFTVGTRSTSHQLSALSFRSSTSEHFAVPHGRVTDELMASTTSLPGSSPDSLAAQSKILHYGSTPNSLSVRSTPPNLGNSTDSISIHCTGIDHVSSDQHYVRRAINGIALSIEEPIAPSVAASTTEDSTSANNKSNAGLTASSDSVYDAGNIHDIEQIEHPAIRNGYNEFPFTYFTCLLAKWAYREEVVRSMQGNIKCFLTGVKSFQFRDRSTFELNVFVDDGSNICEVLVCHNFIEKVIGHSPKAVTAALSSSDKKNVAEMRETLKKFQKFLANFEGIMLVEMNENQSLPVAIELKQGCLASDAWLLFKRLKTVVAS